jgi:hypothetical protein
MFSTSAFTNPFQNIIIKTKREPLLYYITVATKPHPVLDHLKLCVEKNKETIHVLGESENRAIGWESHQNFGIKLREVCDYLKRSELQEDDIILFTDAYDVIYLLDKTTILERFVEFEKPIVFGCEKYCFPDPIRNTEYMEKDKEFSYLNSGMFIGRVWALRRCIGDYIFDDNHDDQRYWTTKFFANPDLIELDYMNRLFLNIYDINMREFYFDKEKRKANYKGREPVFIHINGPDKTEVNQYIINIVD